MNGSSRQRIDGAAVGKFSRAIESDFIFEPLIRNHRRALE
jgi:hypothetical protein